MRRLVVDASVICKAYFEEDNTEAAQALMASDCILIAPSLIVAEVSNIVWKRLRKGEATTEQGQMIIREVSGNILLISEERLADIALDIAVRLDHPTYDCFYLAAAERWDVRMVTSDRKLIDKTQSTPWQSRTIELTRLWQELVSSEHESQGPHHA